MLRCAQTCPVRPSFQRIVPVPPLTLLCMERWVLVARLLSRSPASILPDLARKIQIRSAKKKLSSGDEVRGYGKHATRWLTKMLQEGTLYDIELVVSSELVVVIDALTNSTIHHLPATAVVGWSVEPNRLEIILDKSCGSITIATDEGRSEIVRSLSLHSSGVALSDLTLRRSTRFESWGFRITEHGIAEVAGGPAGMSGGLKTGDTIRTVNGIPIACMSYAEIAALMDRRAGNSLLLKIVPTSANALASVAEEAAQPAKLSFGEDVTEGAGERPTTLDPAPAAPANVTFDGATGSVGDSEA